MKDDRVYLQHIRDALQDIAASCGSDHGAFLDDRMRQDATLRKLEVIDPAKLHGYLLAASHPLGRFKPRFFARRRQAGAI